MAFLSDALLSLFMEKEARRELRKVRARQDIARRLRSVGLVDRETQIAQLRAQGGQKAQESRSNLIAQAKKIRNKRQDVFNELSPEQKEKLRTLAQTMMGVGGEDKG
ncbi:hypothetical protein [Magnetospira sp. QH-2]|uniref:hypothetical protein n=1 Tax=Magnetospira sp. (strain QH-2) TaxID=1288970 RepID=UPI0003E81660|nr:hypothetical protein [Magnetospira sp. QH-2]CCQ74097.1 Protein of unknown function [Magnetospira sp. QH-2]